MKKRLKDNYISLPLGSAGKLPSSLNFEVYSAVNFAENFSFRDRRGEFAEVLFNSVKSFHDKNKESYKYTRSIEDDGTILLNWIKDDQEYQLAVDEESVYANLENGGPFDFFTKCFPEIAVSIISAFDRKVCTFTGILFELSSPNNDWSAFILLPISA